jgi:hypothetical protein
MVAALALWLAYAPLEVAWDMGFNGATGPDAMSTLDNVRCVR